MAARILRGQEEAPGPGVRGENEGIIRIELEAEATTLPSDSKIKLASSPGRLEVSLPPAGLANPAAIGMGGFSLFWLAFVAFWTFSAAAMGAPIVFVLFSLPFWAVGIGMARSTLISLFRRSTLVLDAEAGISLNERIIGKGRTRSWPLADLGKCSVAASSFQMKGANDKELVLEAGAKPLRLGRSLSERELRAVADSIEAWRRGGGR
jgi:hypothetical protein